MRSSRTFAVGIEILPEPLRGEITVAYLLLRVSDYLEDNQELDDARKIALLGSWSRVLSGEEERALLIERLKAAREDTPDAFVARHAGTVLDGLERLAPDAREILTRRVRESSAGMARWVGRGSVFETEADLDDYMHEVAGRVGLLLTELFALRLSGLAGRRDRMMRLGREFGLALQTVNVIRGLHEDRDRGLGVCPRGVHSGPGDAAGATLRAGPARDRDGRSGQAGREGRGAPGRGPRLHSHDPAAPPSGAPVLHAAAVLRGAHARPEPRQPGRPRPRNQDDAP